ncbi:hypothetical protein [Candidatus Nesciobacter abundans]|uniref:Uncharacterized protein n=1 Tax=Candidatus Nesciobacter abundans TaxID=2601668 RepID=A0A5C0UH95_9PROT|nr:hypothetical protein [Candidatus Nesciobacter abundans]QEK39110.1 hypothetical protein FZC36_01505 [Candidatus Nesciobacter abundans]
MLKKILKKYTTFIALLVFIPVIYIFWFKDCKICRRGMKVYGENKKVIDIRKMKDPSIIAFLSIDFKNLPISRENYLMIFQMNNVHDLMDKNNIKQIIVIDGRNIKQEQEESIISGLNKIKRGNKSDLEFYIDRNGSVINLLKLKSFPSLIMIKNGKQLFKTSEVSDLNIFNMFSNISSYLGISIGTS